MKRSKNDTKVIPPPSASKPGLKENNLHILIIRLSAMGDVAMTVPVLSALLRQYPDLKVTVLTKPFFRPMFSQFKNVEVFGAEVKGRHKGVFGLWKLYRELKSQKIDAVADLHNVLRSKILNLYFRSGGIPVAQIDKGRAEKRALTASKNKVFEPLKTTQERYADVLGRAGFPLDVSKAHFLNKEKLSSEITELLRVGSSQEFSFLLKPNSFKKRNGFKESNISNASNTVANKGNMEKLDRQKWLGIAPFAAFEGKMYPLPLMEEVIKKLTATEKYKILLFGGGDKEIQKLEALAARFKSCVNVAGKLSFPEELALISNVDLMLSMDSGNGHLAAMYGIPVITLWGTTHPYAGFYPFGQDTNNALLADREKFPLIPTSVYGNKMPGGYEKAMETILPEDVVAKIETILKTI